MKINKYLPSLSFNQSEIKMKMQNYSNVSVLFFSGGLAQEREKSHSSRRKIIQDQLLPT